MNYNKEDYYSINDFVVKIRLFVNYLKKCWWVAVLAISLGVIGGVIYFNLQKPKYEATCTFILEEKQSGIGGNIGSLASQFGIDIGGIGAGGSIFSGDNILDILKSKKVVQQVLLSTMKNDRTPETTLCDSYLEFSKLKEKWKNKPTLADISFKNASVTQLSAIQDSVLNIVYDKILKKNLIAERINKKGSIIKVQVTAGNSLFAKVMTERLIEEASKMYLDIKVGTAQANINKMQRRSDSLLMLLNRKSFTIAASQPLDINPGIKTAVVPVEIATRDKTVLSTLYAEVTKNLEASKLLLSQQTPIIQILDKPGETLFDNKSTFIVSTGVGGILAFLLFFFSLIILFYLKSIKKV